MNIKRFGVLAAGVLVAALVGGCHCDKCDDASKASMGAVSKDDCSKSCSEKAACTDKASMGAVGEKKAECSSKSSCSDKASMGVVSELKTGTCSGKVAN